MECSIVETYRSLSPLPSELLKPELASDLAHLNPYLMACTKAPGGNEPPAFCRRKKSLFRVFAIITGIVCAEPLPRRGRFAHGGQWSSADFSRGSFGLLVVEFLALSLEENE